MSHSRDAREQERLIDYVRQALARLDAGEEVDPVALCRDHPELARPLADVLGMAGDLPLLQQVALREDPLAGVVLGGRYRLADCLGRGAMGVVYRGEDQELRRPVAVKILDVRLFHDAEAERRFAREAEALASLAHEHVVAVYDRGRTPEGIHFLVMELLEGATLAALLERIASGVEPAAAHHELLGATMAEPGWPRQCARWARDLAQALGAAHSQQLVHRDVKPSNVFLARPGRPVLLDFGIAARGSAARLTATQTTLGTPWYMAPEQVRAGAAVVAAPTLDAYGLGASLWHMLAGRPPYEGDAAAVLAALQTQDPRPLLAVRPGLPRDLVAIVERCLERDPARRYADGTALAGDLDAFLRHEPVAARPIGALQRRLRGWRRAPARPVAFGAALVTALSAVIVVPILREREAEAKRREKVALEATLPSLLAIEGWPEDRVLAVLRPEHRTGVQLLDRLLELDPEDVAARLLRGCLSLDLGEGERAAADLRALAAQDRSPYVQELARRYAVVRPDERGVRIVDLADLPEPATAGECFVAGFHELRNSHVPGFAARADALLARAAPTLPAARAQRLFSLAALADRAVEPARTELTTKLYHESVALEAVHGGPTARTTAMRGVALLLQKRYRECVPEFEHSLRLRPDRHGPHNNLGIALRRLHRFDEAEVHLQRALELRPFAWNTRYTQAQLAADRGQWALANGIARGLEKTGPRDEASRQPDLVGTLAVEEALAAWRIDREVAKAAAARAVIAYDESLAARASKQVQLRRAFAAALATDEPGAALVPFAKAMMTDPLNALQLANLAFLMPPDGLGATQTAQLQALLRRLSQRLADGDEAFVARMEELIPPEATEPSPKNR